MRKAIQAEDLAPRPKDNDVKNQASGASRELANYVADMLHSLRTCTKSPDLKSLEALLLAAEIEALRIRGTETAPHQAPSQRVDVRTWRGGQTRN
jgi:hypothetical protein